MTGTNFILQKFYGKHFVVSEPMDPSLMSTLLKFEGDCVFYGGMNGQRKLANYKKYLEEDITCVAVWIDKNTQFQPPYFTWG
jgi:hypothetical protein